MENLTTTELLGNTTIATTTVTRMPFLDMPGTLYNFHEMAAVDWDEVYNGVQVVTRKYTTWNALNITRLALAVWILTSHLAIIVLILGKKVLREHPKNILIINVALADLLLGIFVVPVKLHFILDPDHVQCGLAVGWTFIMEYFQSSLALLTVLSLVVERFLYVITEKKKMQVLPRAACAITAILFISPWIISVILLVPTFLGGVVARSPLDPENCVYKVLENYFLACHLLTFVPGVLGLFVFGTFTGLLDCLRPTQCIQRASTPKGETVAVTAVICFVSVFCEVPYSIVRILMTRMECDNPYCVRFSESVTMTMWVRISKAAIFPLIWLLYTDIREAMVCRFSLDSDYGSDSDDDDKEDHDERQKFPLTRRESS